MYSDTIKFIQSLFSNTDIIPLHEPKFIGNEKKYLNNCIDSTFVSSIGEYVEQFENLIAAYTDSQYAVATVNGTSALHLALMVAGVMPGDEVITQPLSFVATCNAISYCSAQPVFVDVDKGTLGLSADSLEQFLNENTYVNNKTCINKHTGNTVRACVPMHTFGHPCEMDRIQSLCRNHHIHLIEDAAEALGSRYQNLHTGTFGDTGVLSFNGNKIITSGGGGCLLTNNKQLADKARHLSTTAKVSHQWAFSHDETGWNYRMPNLNAALLVAQLENLDRFLQDKRELAECYQGFFSGKDEVFVTEPKQCQSNYWLNALIFPDKALRDIFLNETNSHGVMTRPAWELMNKQPMYKHCFCTDLTNAQWLVDRLVNIPSSVRL